MSHVFSTATEDNCKQSLEHGDYTGDVTVSVGGYSTTCSFLKDSFCIALTTKTKI